MLRNTLVQNYSLDSLRVWGVIDRLEPRNAKNNETPKELCLLDGFYAGKILATDGSLEVDWIPREWLIERISEPITGEIATSEIRTPEHAGGNFGKQHRVTKEAFRVDKEGNEIQFVQAFRTTNYPLPPLEQQKIARGSIIQVLPEGPIVRLWKYQGKNMISSRFKINDETFLHLFSKEQLMNAGENPTYYVIALPEFQITYQKELQGIFNLEELPELTITEANEWLGFSTGDDWRLSGGESVLLTDTEGNRTVLKPHSKVWRESVVIENSYPDNYLLGAVIERVNFSGNCSIDDLYCRFIEMTSVGNIPEDEYLIYWPKLINSVKEPYQRISNTYYCLLKCISSRFVNSADYYHRWYGVQPSEDFTKKIKKLPENDYAPSAGIEKLIYNLWEKIKGEHQSNKLISRLRKHSFGHSGKPWDNFLDLFVFKDKHALTGIELNRLRKSHGNTE